VRGELQAHGFAFDEKRFLPHVTLMRKANLTGGALPAPIAACGEIDTVTLFKSNLSGERPLYEPLRTIVLP
jgi:2'-5' RNA ligase